MLSECCENKGQRGCTFWKPHKPLYPIQDSEVGIQVIGQVLDHQGLPHYRGQIMKHPPQEIIPLVPGNFLQDLLKTFQKVVWFSSWLLCWLHKSQEENHPTF